MAKLRPRLTARVCARIHLGASGVPRCYDTKLLPINNRLQPNGAPSSCMHRFGLLTYRDTDMASCCRLRKDTVHFHFQRLTYGRRAWHGTCDQADPGTAIQI